MSPKFFVYWDKPGSILFELAFLILGKFRTFKVGDRTYFEQMIEMQ